MYVFLVIGIPILIVILIFILTAKKTIKRKLKEIGVVLGTILLMFLTLAPSTMGLPWNRSVRTNYDIPNNFEIKRYDGLRKTSVRGIELIQETPIFVVENEYRVEIYAGKYLYESIDLIATAYEWHDAIGITVYDGENIILKDLLPSMMNVDTLELVSTDPITIRTSTEEYYYEYIIEIESLDNANSNDAFYYSVIKEKPIRNYYIPFNHELVEIVVKEEGQ